MASWPSPSMASGGSSPGGDAQLGELFREVVQLSANGYLSISRGLRRQGYVHTDKERPMEYRVVVRGPHGMFPVSRGLTLYSALQHAYGRLLALTVDE